MYVNDRDQINYHGFLKALREMQVVSVPQVSEGICSKSEVTRMENGDRLPEKLLRDRITARLGVSGEKYEEYLRAEEYRQWQTRMHILDCIDKGLISEARETIVKLEEISESNPVTKQFIETMRYMCMQLTGTPKEILRDQIYLTLIHTVPSPDLAFSGLHLLSDQELNLIMEQIHVCEYTGNPRDDAEWRMRQYRKVMDYIDNSYIDAIGKSKLYPKLACFVCELLVNEDMSSGKLLYALDLCTKAIEMLRDASRLYYFVELLEWRRKILTILIDRDGVAAEKQEYHQLLEKNNEWETLLKELYTEYNVPIYMSTFTYLYVETECNNAIEVIRKRRNMLKISRARLGDGLCAEKTIIRFEKYETSPTIYLMREIFNRINLCPEYRRSRVLTHEPKALAWTNKVVDDINNYEYEEAKKNLEILKELLSTNVSYNNQIISFMENTLEYEKGKIDKEEYAERNIKALEETISVEAVMRRNDKYFTKSEWSCLNGIAFQSNGELACRCRHIIEKACREQMDKKIEVARLTLYELLVGSLTNYLGNDHQYNKSNQLILMILKESLYNRRMVNVYYYIYNLWWNNKEISKQEQNRVEPLYGERMLKWTILFCELGRMSQAIPFFEDKLRKIQLEIAEN